MRAERADLECWDRVAEVVHGAGRRGEVQNVVYRSVDQERIGDVVVEQAEARIAAQVIDVRESPGDQVIDADDFMALGQEAIAEMGAEEAGASGNDGTHCAHCSDKSGTSGASLGDVGLGAGEAGQRAIGKSGRSRYATNASRRLKPAT